jgi:hypothetical protein
MSHPTIFGDGVIDVHVANGVVRVTLGAVTGQKDAKPEPSGTIVVPVLQLPAFAKVLAEVTRQVEQRAREAMAAQQQKAPGAVPPAPAGAPQEGDQVVGAFRFNG